MFFPMMMERRDLCSEIKAHMKKESEREEKKKVSDNLETDK